MCSDVCGLAASLYKRGIDFEIVPTTLLAMADASVGGKNGVNLDGVKNMIGTFKLPRKIHIRKEVLRTLPRKEVLSGSAEILKTFLLFDEKLYNKAVGVFSELAKMDSTGGNGQDGQAELEEMLGEAAELAEKAAKYKRKVVKRDLFDRGRRHILNFGHTFAHAIEWRSHEAVSHGEAVSMGIIKSLRMSEKEGWSEKGLADRVRDDFKRCNLPVELPYSDEELQEALKNDKPTGQELGRYPRDNGRPIRGDGRGEGGFEPAGRKGLGGISGDVRKTTDFQFSYRAVTSR